MRVFRNTHMRVPTAAIGWPALDLVQPSTDFFCHTHVCAHSSSWSAKKDVHNLQLALSLDYSATHMCVLTAAIGRPTLS